MGGLRVGFPPFLVPARPATLKSVMKVKYRYTYLGLDFVICCKAGPAGSCDAACDNTLSFATPGLILRGAGVGVPGLVGVAVGCAGSLKCKNKKVGRKNFSEHQQKRPALVQVQQEVLLQLAYAYKLLQSLNANLYLGGGAAPGPRAITAASAAF